VKMLHGTYVGSDERLRGKTALLRAVFPLMRDAYVLAQFDDTSEPEAFGWHRFTVDDFELDAKACSAARVTHVVSVCPSSDRGVCPHCGGRGCPDLERPLAKAPVP
jgi:hypothetical protein